MNERIKRIRLELGLTQREFAERIGLKQNSIALIESGKRNISEQAVLSICREYRVNEEWLRNGTGEMFAPEASDELEAVAKKYNLSQIEYLFLERYLHLDSTTRKEVLNFLTHLATDISEDPDNK